MKKLLISLVATTIAFNVAHAQSKDMFAAARSNDVAAVKRLVEAKTDVNQQDDKGYTPLILATYNDNFEVAEFLVKHGANTELKDRSGRTALMGSAFKGNDREVKLLLDNGANASATDSKGITSMMYAVMFGRLAVIQTLRGRTSASSANRQVSSTK